VIARWPLTGTAETMNLVARTSGMAAGVIIAVASWAPARKYLDEAATSPLAGPGFAHDKTLSYNDASTAIVGS